jgi:hypothetical protein
VYFFAALAAVAVVPTYANADVAKVDATAATWKIRMVRVFIFFSPRVRRRVHPKQSIHV